MNDQSLPTRDFIGYADRPPNVNWPGDARVAVNFCINYEEGGELCVLNGDDRSEIRLSDVDVVARPGGRDLNIESSYEYGSRVGYWRLLKAFTDRGLTATVNLVGLAGQRNPRALRAMIDAGFDLQPHGWRWFDYHELDVDTEREYIRRSIEQVRELTGEPPLGYYAGLPSLNTRRLVVETKCFVYDSDVYNDENNVRRFETGSRDSRSAVPQPMRIEAPAEFRSTGSAKKSSRAWPPCMRRFP